MGYDKKRLLERYQRWKKRYLADGGTDPCFHKMFEEQTQNNNILEFLQHESKVYAGEQSQETQHEQHLTIEQELLIVEELR